MPRKERVTKIIDGDTFETDKRKHPIRIADIDTPEKRQPGYMNAKKALEKMIKGEEVIIDTQARDKFGRSVARVYKARKSVGKAMKRYEKK